FSVLFLSLSRVLPYLHSFPTRRSSDLLRALCAGLLQRTYETRSVRALRPAALCRRLPVGPCAGADEHAGRAGLEGVGCRSRRRRSEEHTSELQSQSNLVCRLLLEKKKK